MENFNESGLKFETTPKPYPTEGKLLIDGMLEELGLSREDFLKLPPEEKLSITNAVRESLRQPEVSEILNTREEEGLSAETAHNIREIIGVEKWNHLSETVSYVKTLLGEKTPAERQNEYTKHLAFGVDANEIKHTLTNIHDVMPARLDTDIKHQSSLFYRAVVEVASNALDASIKHRSPIGRFGVGFYQVLNHLKDSKDRVIVKTKSADEAVGIKIEFRNKDGQIDFKVSEDESITDHGTIVELDSKEFVAEKAEEIIKEYFSHNQDAELLINDEKMGKWKPTGGAQVPEIVPSIDLKIEDGKCVITDHGIGMNPRVVFEKLLVPKLSEKPPVYELKDRGKVAPKIYYESSADLQKNKGEILIQVGGIVIEKEKSEGTSIAMTLVIDLPPSTILGEQRDEIEVNEDTVEAFKNAIDQAIVLPRPDCFQVINSLGAACRKFQNRSKLYEQDDNMYVYLQNRVRETFPDVYFLPNIPEFHELDLDDSNVAFLDTEIYQSPVELVKGLKKVPQWSSKEGTPLFEAKFKEGSTLGIIATDNYLIIDERAQAGMNPDIVNKAIELAAGWGKGEISELSTSEIKKEREIKTFESLQDMVSEQWEHLSFNSQEIAVRQARLYERKNPELVRVFTEKVLSRLHTIGASEAWDVLHWYVNADDRDLDTQLQEIESLGKNLEKFSQDPKLNEILKTNGIPILSMFETYNGNLPKHLREIEEDEKTITVDHNKYYLSTKHNDTRRYIDENGNTVDLYGPGEIIFRDSEITIYSDKAVNTQTGEPLSIEIPFTNSWGTVRMETYKGKDKFYFGPHPHVKEIFDEHTWSGSKTKHKNWEIKENTIYNEGKSLVNQDFIKTKAGIDQYTKLKNVISIGEADSILVFNNITSRDEGNNSFYLESASNKDQESFHIVDIEGNILWQFDKDEWPDKIFAHEKYSYSNYKEGTTSQDEEFIEENRERAAQCIPISYDRQISPEEPIVKIVKYYFFNSARYRKTIGYVNGKGEVTKLAETEDINALTLEAKYSAEGSCPCCDIQCEFTKARYDSFIKETDENPLQIEKLPVDIVGDFKYDAKEEQWSAMAREKQTDQQIMYLAIFDKAGKFVRTEKIGMPPQILDNEFDFRNPEKHLKHRLPDRLRNSIKPKDKESNRYWSYEGEVRKLISLEDNKVVLKRNTGSTYSAAQVPVLQEADNVVRNLFDPEKGEIRKEHADELRNFLLQHPVMDREKLERVAYRVLEYRNIDPLDMRFLLPVFYEVAYIPPNFFDNEVLEQLRKVSYLDSERFTKLFMMIKESLPEDGIQKTKILNKIIKFYIEKFQSESLEDTTKLINDLSNVRDYSNAVHCDGYTLIRNNISVPAAEVPRSLRPFLTFVQREEDELAYKNKEIVKIPEIPAQTIKLSEIIQWKRLNETEAREFNGPTQELGKIINSSVEGKAREHIVREITHAVHFQALNSTDLYVRELIQNAVDVMQAEGMKQENRNIEITASTNDKELTTAFRDPVGMDIHAILNYFLVPGESTKLDRSKGFIGFYGQGVYTLFKDFKEINIKTGTGEGPVWYLTIKPIIEHDMVNDVSIDFRSAEEEFKGTIISKTKMADNPYIEAAYVKDAVMTLTSALSDERASIKYQDEKVNTEYKTLAQSNVEGLGQVTVRKNPNNIVTQYGLFVKDINGEYSELVPAFINKSLRDWGGISIDLPDNVELTRSRQDIANKDKIKEILNPEIQKTMVFAYLNAFKQKMESGEAKFPFKELPYDYFSEGQNYDLPYSYKKDIEALLAGKPLEHLENYTDKNNILKLLSLLPIFEINDTKQSLDDIREAFLAKEKKPPFDQADWKDQLPDELNELLSDQGRNRQQRENIAKQDLEVRIEDTTLEDVFRQSKGELRKWMEEKKDKLELVDKMTKEFVAAVNKAFNRNAGSGFYYSLQSEIAHAYRGGDLSWNLGFMQRNSWHSVVKEIEEFLGEGGGKISNLMDGLETLAHEYGHIVEDAWAWSHDEKHNKEQARILIQFLIQNGPQKILEAIKSK